MFSSSASTEADRLASLALKAATQLDKVERGRSKDFAPVREFLEEIANFSGVDRGMEGSLLSLDPATSEMFSAAVSRVTERRISDLGSLKEELAKFIGNILSNMEQLSTQEAVKQLKEFSLSIHDYVLRNRTFNTLNETGVFDYDNYSG